MTERFALAEVNSTRGARIHRAYRIELMVLATVSGCAATALAISEVLTNGGNTGSWLLRLGIPLAPLSMCALASSVYRGLGPLPDFADVSAEGVRFVDASNRSWGVLWTDFRQPRRSKWSLSWEDLSVPPLRLWIRVAPDGRDSVRAPLYAAGDRGARRAYLPRPAYRAILASAERAGLSVTEGTSDRKGVSRTLIDAEHWS